jgi:hypothetical protein
MSPEQGVNHVPGQDPEGDGGQGQNRTTDTRIFSRG